MPKLITFTLDEQRYALRLSVVERIVRMVEISPLPKAPDGVLGVIDLQGRIVPVLDLRRRFGLSPRDPDLNDHLLVARTSRRTVALAVDEVLGIVERPDGEAVPSQEVLSGIAHVEAILKLEDGLVFIHDLEGFLCLEEEKALSEALGGSAAQ
jgi:purine-binding chemotaxis protein CheW